MQRTKGKTKKFIKQPKKMFIVNTSKPLGNAKPKQNIIITKKAKTSKS